jgi:predicted GNAT superfamily acetyltransferase
MMASSKRTAIERPARRRAEGVTGRAAVAEGTEQMNAGMYAHVTGTRSEAGDPGGGQVDDVVVEADTAATAAARRLALTVSELRDTGEQQTAAELLRRIWRADSPDQVLNGQLMRALAYTGNYVVGAFRDGEMVGIAVAFFGAGHLHSHIAGVDAARQSGGVGYALKLHQRAWALDRGITTVSWTFDPLVRRNAYFNLHKLAARAAEYLPDFYGPMTDGINAGDASDRIYLRWRLDEPQVVGAARGQRTDVDVAAVTAAGGHVLLGRDAGGAPAPGRATYDGGSLLVAVPADVEELRGRDPSLAARWRYAVRDALVGALAEGYRITGMARNGWYLLEVDA